MIPFGRKECRQPLPADRRICAAVLQLRLEYARSEADVAVEKKYHRPYLLCDSKTGRSEVRSGVRIPRSNGLRSLALPPSSRCSGSTCRSRISPSPSGASQPVGLVRYHPVERCTDSPSPHADRRICTAALQLRLEYACSEADVAIEKRYHHPCPPCDSMTGRSEARCDVRLPRSNGLRSLATPPGFR